MRRAIDMEGLHFHELRHAGNYFAAASGAGLKDLMARMGHDSERAALICQHEARGAGKRTCNPGLLRGLTCGVGCPQVTVRDPVLPGLMAR
jgi:hypothetical protein